MIQKGWKILYEAAFQYDAVLAALDILVCMNNKWYAFEVKSSFVINETHLHDAALQYHVITKSGFTLEDFRIIYRDKNYQTSETQDIKRMFSEQSVLDYCRNSEPTVIENIEIARDVITSKMMPDVAIGEHCDNPYPCDFKGICWKGVKL